MGTGGAELGTGDISGTDGPVSTARIYDVRDRLVADLTGTADGGTLSLIWNGRDRVGQSVPTGIHLVRWLIVETSGP